MKKLALWQMLLVCFSISTGLLVGQNVSGNGSVTGRVTDPSGAAVPGAEVDLVDEATNIPIKLQTNTSGLYVFNNVSPGKYDLMVSKAGFRKSIVSAQEVTTGTALTLDVTMQIGTSTETVEVTSVAGAELQTESATMGTSLGGNAILTLPTISRDVSSLVFLQPTAAPTFNGAEGNTTSGNIAGSFADQNTFLLDGGNNTSDLDGDNATYVAHNGSGVMPTPAESVEEFRVNTNNMGADFSMSSGGQVMISTKRGTNQFHGAAYDFFQADWLNSNDWYNNFQGIAKPKAHFNRFGGALGGPLGPKFLGGKTYFYANYEGQRYPRSGPFERTVPSATLRQGIIQERDANGNIVQYNLATSTACGTTGGKMCDPLGIGLNPQISQLWNKYEPACNDFNNGDHGLNTCGFIGQLTFPLTNDFGVVRIDHDFGDKWRFFSSYRYYRNINPTTNQVDIGGLLPGDKLGAPASASTNIQQPRFLVVGITGTLSPTLTNQFHFSYTRNDWQWLRAGASPQLPGITGALEVGGENSQALIPVNVDTQDARARLWIGHDYDFRDDLSKLWGTHLFQVGGEFFPENWRFDRYDNVVGGLTSLVDNVSNTGIAMTSDFQPIPCGGGLTANCLPSSKIGSWNTNYAEILGLMSASSVVVTRTGSNLTANPLGTPVHSNVSDKLWNIYFNDTWKIKPNFTLSYGLNYQVQMPPLDAKGEQDILVNAATNTVLTTESYLGNVLSAANSGAVYNPTIGFSPIGAIKGLNYPYKPFYGEIAPRVAIAWTPDVSSGWLHALLGDKATVIRVGYGRSYSRSLGIDLVSTPVLGDGFLQPVTCANPTTAGVCTAPSGTDPTTAFRVGINGNPPVGSIAQTLTAPVTPGVNGVPSAELITSLDNNWRPGSSDSVDFSIQRQFKGGFLAEVGYVGVYSHHLFQGIDLNNVPWMMKLGGQTFANAYDNLYFALSKNQAITPQPFLESALKGSSYCNGASSCTAAVAAGESGNITTQSVTNLWSDLDGSFNFGPSILADAGQCTAYCYTDTSLGYSNYNALTASLQKRASNGLTLNANFTFGKSLGIIGLNQAYTLNNVNNPWDLSYDYGPQFWDRKFTFNFLASYQLPFGKGQKFASSHTVLNDIIGGWVISPIFSYGSGLPLDLYTGSYQEFGNGYDGNGCAAVPLSSMGYANTPHFGVVSDGNIGVNGDPANGGSGVNMFTNPTAVYNNFRPALVGIDTTCGGGGQLRGQQRWNLDLGLTKDTPITERVGVQFYAQAFNVLNHMQWGDPSMNLQDPADFGVLGGQYGALALGGGGGSANYTRIIQLGIRVRF